MAKPDPIIYQPIMDAALRNAVDSIIEKQKSKLANALLALLLCMPFAIWKWVEILFLIIRAMG